MYGTQATSDFREDSLWFENDVKMYGTQAQATMGHPVRQFENDVKMYGTQAYMSIATMIIGLRMM